MTRKANAVNKAAHLLQNIEYMEQNTKTVLDTSHDKERKSYFRH